MTTEIGNDSRIIQDILSWKKCCEELEARKPTINSLPRDWTQQIENPVIFGVRAEPMEAIKHLIVRQQKTYITIDAYFPEGPEPFETFATREKLDSFIEALQLAGNAVFND